MTDVAYTQDDWMGALLQQHPDLGRLVWFRVDEAPVDAAAWLQAVVDAGLAQYGTPSGIPATTGYLRGLAALKAQTPHRTLIRRVARAHGTTEHHWIRDEVIGGQVVFTPIAAIRYTARTESLQVTPLAPRQEEQAALAQLPDLIATARRTYTAGDRRRQVRHWLQRTGALTMANAGPVTFLPVSAAGLMTALDRAKTALGLEIWSLPLTRSADVVATLTQQLDADVQQKTAALVQRVRTARAAGRDLTVAQQEALVRDLHALDDRIRAYEALFGTQLDQLQNALTVAHRVVYDALVG